LVKCKRAHFFVKVLGCLSFVDGPAVKLGGMDPASIAAAMVAAQASQTQMAVAAKMLRMNADQAASVVQLLDSAQKNIASLVGPGIGQNLDISA